MTEHLKPPVSPLLGRSTMLKTPVQEDAQAPSRVAALLRPSAATGAVVNAEPIMSSKADLDGLDHINIDAKAKTELGRKLSHLTRSDFVHPEFGPFHSIEGFIGYLRSGMKDDQFRYLSGPSARYRSRIQETEFIQGFREAVMEANYFKIMQNASLLARFKASTLPFDHYYLFENNGLPIQPNAAAWLIPAFEELRHLIQSDKPYPEMDYTGLKKLNAQ